MANKMGELKAFILQCTPGIPTWRNKKTLKSPEFLNETLRIKTLFKMLIKTVPEAIALRGGLEVFHIVVGRRARRSCK